MAAAVEQVKAADNEVNREALERAAFARAIAVTRIEAINAEEAEWRHMHTGDERGLGKLKQLGRRGRPRAVGQTFLTKVMDGIIPSSTTPRTKLNHWYSSKGATALGLRDTKAQRTAVLEYFVGPVGSNREFRLSALTELGRISDKFGAD